MRGALGVIALVVGLLVPSAAALADVDQTIGNCEHGRITTIYNNNSTTGETRIIVCNP
jgi:hypothetical protein